MYCLNNLKTQIHNIRHAMDRLESKIEEEGLDGYYSCNHDVLRHAQQIWKCTALLGELRALTEEFKK